MKPTKIILIIIILLLLALVASFALQNNEAPTYSVTLTASTDKQSYNSGDPIVLTVDLTNTGETATCISDTAQGNLAFTSILRDGQPVTSRTVDADFLEALAEFVRVDLESVNPGEKTTIVLTSSYDPGIEAQALHTSEINGISAMTTFYSVEEPGEYEIQMNYEYSGNDSSDCSAIFQGQTNAATVNFIVE